MRKSILRFFGLCSLTDHLIEVNDLEDELVKERRLNRELREDLEELPYQMDYLARLYNKGEIDAFFHKLANEVRAKYPELIDKWLKRFKAAKSGKRGREIKGN